MSLAREVFLAQKADLKAQQEQQEFRLQEERRAAQANAEIELARIEAQAKQQRQVEQQNIVDAQVAQVNALTRSISQRTQASSIRFGAQQDRLSTAAQQVDRDAELASSERNQRRQAEQGASSLGRQSAQVVAQQAGQGGVSSQNASSIRSNFTSLARENANVNRESSGLRARSDVQAEYERRLMAIQAGLAHTQASSLELQADVNQQLQETVAGQNESTARSNRSQVSRDARSATSAIKESIDQANINYAEAIRNSRKQTRASINQARRTLL